MDNYTSSAVDFLKGARALIEDSTFQRQCIDRLLDSKVTADIANIGFVDGLGHAANDAINNITSRVNIWGIDYTTCSSACNYKALPFPFSYSTFSSAMTNYLLPWLALTAQLPYETGTHPANLMALFLALGSPVLITYSLSLTVIHSYKLKTLFDYLKGLRSIDHSYKEHLNTIQEVLQAAQHVPLRASQYNGWLSSLLVLRENDKWWSKVKELLMARVRDFSPSALAQIGVAIVAWLLTIVAALSTKLGDPDTGLQIASGSLWIWLVPVVVGYIRVGVPNSAKAAPEAFLQPGAHNAERSAASGEAPGRERSLNANSRDDADSLGDIAASAGRRSNSDAGITAGVPMIAYPTHATSRASHSATPASGHSRQHSDSRSAVSPAENRPASDGALAAPSFGEDVAHGNSSDPEDSAIHLPSRRKTLLDDPTMRGVRTSGDIFNALGEPIDIKDMPTALGLPVIGDAYTPGAAYTYARSLEYPFFVELITNALGRSIIIAPRRENASNGQSPEVVAKQCGDDWQVDMNLNPFPRWSQVTADWWHRMIIAALMALFVQWGTTMASFMLAFLTPVQGLGCRSGSYIVYGIASTIAWLLLVIAQLCSNEAMRIFQEKRWTSVRGSVRPRRPVDDSDDRSVIVNIQSQPHGTDPDQHVRRQSTVQTEANSSVGQDSEVKYTILKRSAVLCRLSGKGLCILNTVWLLLTSVAEIIGGFDNCWCLANRPSSGRDSWIVLFKTSEDLASQANSSWGGGFAITIMVSIIAIFFFAVGSPRHRGS